MTRLAPGGDGLRDARKFRIYVAHAVSANLVKVGATSDERDDLSRRLTFLRHESGVHDWRLAGASPFDLRCGADQARTAEALLKLHLLPFGVVARRKDGGPREYFGGIRPEILAATARLAEVSAREWPSGAPHPLIIAVWPEEQTGLDMSAASLLRIWSNASKKGRKMCCPLCRAPVHEAPTDCGRYSDRPLSRASREPPRSATLFSTGL